MRQRAQERNRNMNKENFNHKILAFTASLSDAYKDDDERVGASAGKLDLNEENLTPV